jgi:CIC family chloride channel protein
VREVWRDAWHVLREHGPSRLQLWIIALLIGIGSGYAAVGFMLGVERLQKALYRVDDPRHLHSFAADMPWWWILLLPTVGGLVVGLILARFTPDGRVRAVADVIEGAALSQGRVERRAGLASACASLITLSSGGSSGREGPVVHLAGVISTAVANRMNADGVTGRDLLGCAVAAAVSASFNAPIAGAIFALEVVLRHFAVHAFAPIVIASAAGTVISRTHFGDVTEFRLPTEGVIAFYAELPAFLILGLVSGVVAVVLMRAIFLAEDWASSVQRRIRLPQPLRPAVAGLILGAVAIFFPHIIGVGYETTSAALSGDLLLREAIVFAALKVFAVAVTMGGRMGGGVFSPALMVGALTGLAFGLIATALAPEISGAETVYALAGMGAVSAAVLGAPISTTLIVFELTGDWQTGLAVMLAVSSSTALAGRLVDRSFFLTQLERKGVHLAAGPQAYLLGMTKVTAVMRALEHPRAPKPDRVRRAVNEGLFVGPDATLQAAMPLFERTNAEFVVVVRMEERPVASGPPEVLGVVMHLDALKAFSRALAAKAAEEHS